MVKLYYQTSHQSTIICFNWIDICYIYGTDYLARGLIGLVVVASFSHQNQAIISYKVTKMTTAKYLVIFTLLLGFIDGAPKPKVKPGSPVILGKFS